MAWTDATVANLRKRLQFSTIVASATNAIDETVLQNYLDSAIAEVDSVLLYREVTPSTLQAATTTSAYKYCNNLILEMATLGVLETLRASTPQASQLTLGPLRDRAQGALDKLLNQTRFVLADYDTDTTDSTGGVVRADEILSQQIDSTVDGASRTAANSIFKSNDPVF